MSRDKNTGAKILAMRTEPEDQCCELKPESGVPTAKPSIFAPNPGLRYFWEGLKHTVVQKYKVGTFSS